MRSYVKTITPILLMFSICCISCAPHSAYERQQYLMGTKATVIIYKGDNEAANLALNQIRNLDNLLSDYKPESQISKINNSAGVKPIPVDSDVVEVLEISKRVAAETNGFFDPTIGALTIDVYRFGRENSKIPKKSEIKKAKKLVNYEDLLIDVNKVFLQKRGMKIDLGGIGKGFALDKAVDVLKQSNVKEALVSLSGDIRVFGKNIYIAIQNPFDKGRVASFKTGGNDLSISTSGNYRRFLEENGKKVSHLLMPDSGKSGGDFSSITVVMNGNSTLSDAYSTALFVMGKKRALEFIENRNDIGVFFIFNDTSIFINDNFRNFIKDLKIEKNQLF